MESVHTGHRLFNPSSCAKHHNVCALENESMREREHKVCSLGAPTEQPGVVGRGLAGSSSVSNWLQDRERTVIPQHQAQRTCAILSVVDTYTIVTTNIKSPDAGASLQLHPARARDTLAAICSALLCMCAQNFAQTNSRRRTQLCRKR
jgi:hypothetical protein